MYPSPQSLDPELTSGWTACQDVIAILNKLRFPSGLRRLIVTSDISQTHASKELKEAMRLLMDTNPRLCALVMQVHCEMDNQLWFIYATRRDDGGVVTVDSESGIGWLVERYLESRGWSTCFQDEDI